MGQRYLLDTNVVLDFIGGKFPQKTRKIMFDIIDDDINISVINKIELLGFAKVEKPVEFAVFQSNVFPIEDTVVTQTIEFRKQYKIKLPDAIIAATAIVNNLTLATRNVKDFNKINKLKIWNPFE